MSKLTWTRERPTYAGWYWVRWPKQPQYGPEIVLIEQPNGPDTDYLEIRDVPLHEYIDIEGGVEWQGPLEPEEGAVGG